MTNQPEDPNEAPTQPAKVHGDSGVTAVSADVETEAADEKAPGDDKSKSPNQSVEAGMRS